MSELTNQTPTAPSITGRRRRFTGAHPYPALPKSRLPLLRGVLLVTWAAVGAIIDAAIGLLPGRRRAVHGNAIEPRGSVTVPRPPRVPSLTPTG